MNTKEHEGSGALHELRGLTRIEFRSGKFEAIREIRVEKLSISSNISTAS